MNASGTTDSVVSIILPTYNREALLARAIDSVLDQTRQDFELIVVDDGSTDGTADAMAHRVDPRIRFLQLEKNRGAGAARNVGIRQATGRYLAFQDSDDEWAPKKLEKQLQCMERQGSDVGVVYCDMARVAADGTVKYYRSPTVVPDRLVDPGRAFYQVYGLGIQSTLIRRECFDQVGTFDERYRCFEDLELFIRLLKHYRFHHLQEPLVRYYKTSGVSTDGVAEFRARTLLLSTYAREIVRTQPLFLVRESGRVVWGRSCERVKQMAVSRLVKCHYDRWRWREHSRFNAL